jgi:hypothetical protein
MDFRPGPQSQVLQRYTASGRATPRALTDAGFDTLGAVNGEVGLNLVYSEYRNGEADLAADADLSQADLFVAPLSWRRQAGSPAKASGRLTLTKGKLTGIDRLTIDGAGIQVRGGVAAAGGRLETVKLDRAILGRSDVAGTIRVPKDGPITIDLAGPALDVAAKVLEKAAKPDTTALDQTGPPGRCEGGSIAFSWRMIRSPIRWRSPWTTMAECSAVWRLTAG